MFQVNSAIKEWVEKAAADGGGVPCVHCENQHDTLEEAIAAAQAHEAACPDEVCEIRRFPGDVGVWP